MTATRPRCATHRVGVALANRHGMRRLQANLNSAAPRWLVLAIVLAPMAACAPASQPIPSPRSAQATPARPPEEVQFHVQGPVGPRARQHDDIAEAEAPSVMSLEEQEHRQSEQRRLETLPAASDVPALDDVPPSK